MVGSQSSQVFQYCWCSPVGSGWCVGRSCGQVYQMDQPGSSGAQTWSLSLGPTVAGMLPCWQNCLNESGRHSPKHGLGKDYEEVLKPSGFHFSEVQYCLLMKKRSPPKLVLRAEKRGWGVGGWGEGGVRLKTKVENNGCCFWLPDMRFFTPGPQGQIGYIQVPQGTVKAGDCDCAAN